MKEKHDDAKKQDKNPKQLNSDTLKTNSIKPTQPSDKLISDRLKKLNELKDLGIEPYPYKYERTLKSDEIRNKYSGIPSENHTGVKGRVAGRIVLMRRMGKVSFATLYDGFGNIQLFFRSDEIGVSKYDLLDKFDLGDFIGAFGEIFKTKMGELSIYVTDFQMLCKAIRPLPEKFHGLKDLELKYRKRYLDLIMNPESKEILSKRMKIIKAVRDFFDSKGFIEVETPILHTVYGGAAARPFKTYHNDLKMDLYLRISPELYLKRLIVGGYDKVYDINKNFRNESIDTTHNPEFTMLEAYSAYSDYNDIMKLTEDLFEYVALKVNGTTKSEFKGNKLDFKTPWKRITMLEAIKTYIGIDVSNKSEKELKKLVNDSHILFEKQPTWGNLVIALFEGLCEEKIIQPTFVIDHPSESSPLCKKHRLDSRLIERFEPFCCGLELANAYSELNDPIHQRKLLEEQARELKAGNLEANPIDEDFLEAIDHGMPPTGGLGVGLDRMAMVLLGQESIRDVILFPTMKPEIKEEQIIHDKKEASESVNKRSKSPRKKER